MRTSKKLLQDGEKPFYLFSPDSISQSYGIMTVSENAVLFLHGSF